MVVGAYVCGGLAYSVLDVKAFNGHRYMVFFFFLKHSEIPI